MATYYKTSTGGSGRTGRIFNISFLLSQLLFSGLLLFYVLRKSEIGFNLLNSVLK